MIRLTILVSVLVVGSTMGGPIVLSGTATGANTAQLNFTDIYNQDVVRGANDTDPGDFDGEGRALVSASVAENNNEQRDDGVPDDGVFAATTDVHPKFDFPDYNSDDINAWQTTGTGSKTADVTDGQYETVHVVASAGGTDPETPAKFKLTLGYADGSIISFQEFRVPDWFGDPPDDPGYAVQDGMDRYVHNNYEDADEPGIWGYAVSANSSKTLTQVTINVTENQAGSFNFFGGAATTQESEVVNDPPTASDDAATTDEDNSIIIDVVDNDNDPNDDSLNVTAIENGPSHGTAQITGTSNDSIRFDPGPDQTSDVSITYVVSDGNGGTDTAMIDVTINPINDAPTLSTDTRSLNAISEDATTNNGTQVSTILSSAGTTADAEGDTLGVAVTSVDDTDGTWEYSTDGGSSWNTITSASPSNMSALLLADTDVIRFIPSTDFSGRVSGAVTVRAWDQTSGSAGDTSVDVSTNGGTTAFSSDTAIARVSVNNAPEVDAISRGVPASQNTNANTVKFDVTFTEAVDGVDDSDFTLNTTNTVNGNIKSFSSVSASTTVTVTVDSVGGDGDLRLDVSDDDSIEDTATDVPLGGVGTTGSADGSFTGDQIYTIDNTNPEFSAGSINTVSIIENSTVSNFLNVDAGDDGTPGAEVSTYSLSSAAGSDASNFSIDSNTGEISLDSALDYETPLDNDTDNDYKLTVTATDDAGNTNTQTVTVIVTDVNEAPAQPSDTDSATNEVAEAASIGDSVGITVSATDVDDANSSLTYTLVDNANGRFQINSGGVITVADTSNLDHERNSSHTVTVEAVDDGGLSSPPKDFTIVITDSGETSSSASVGGSDGGGVSVSMTSGDNAARSVDISNARAGRQIVIGGGGIMVNSAGTPTQSDTTNPVSETKNVRLDQVTIAVASNADIGVDIETYDEDLTPGTGADTPPSPVVESTAVSFQAETKRVAAGYILVNDRTGSDSVSKATLSFSVRAGYLDSLEVAPEDITLYHEQSDGSWETRETAYLGIKDGYYRYEGMTPSFSMFAIGTTAPSVVVTDTSLDSATIMTNETATVRVTLQNRGSINASSSLALTADGDTLQTLTPTVPANASTTITAIVDRPAGTYDIAVDNISIGTLTVESSKNGSDATPVFPTPGIAVIFTVLILLIIGRHQR